MEIEVSKNKPYLIEEKNFANSMSGKEFRVNELIGLNGVKKSVNYKFADSPPSLIKPQLTSAPSAPVIAKWHFSEHISFSPID